MTDVKQILPDAEILEAEILDNAKRVDYKAEKAAKAETQMTSQENDPDKDFLKDIQKKLYIS